MLIFHNKCQSSRLFKNAKFALRMQHPIFLVFWLHPELKKENLLFHGKWKVSLDTLKHILHINKQNLGSLKVKKKKKSKNGWQTNAVETGFAGKAITFGLNCSGKEYGVQSPSWKAKYGKITGSVWRTCLANTSWSGSAPTCRGRPFLDALSHRPGAKNFNSVTFQRTTQSYSPHIHQT